MPEDPSLSRDQARGIGQHVGVTDTLHDAPLALVGYSWAMKMWMFRGKADGIMRDRIAWPEPW